MKSTFNIKISFGAFDGLIARLALVMERRGFTIESLNVSRCSQGYSYIDLWMAGDKSRFQQVINQVGKLVDVVYVEVVEQNEVRVSSVAAA